jgi:hypothetical protein
LQFISEKTLQHLSLPAPLPKATSEEGKQLRSTSSRSFPFLEYACSYVTYHAEQAAIYGLPQVNFVKTFPALVWALIYNTFAKFETRRIELSMATPANVFANQGAWNLFLVEFRSEGCQLSPEQNENALRAAVSDGRIDLMPEILERLCTAPASNVEQTRTLQLAIKNKDLTTLGLILGGSSHVISAQKSRTLLREAIHAGSPEVLRLLIDYGLDVATSSVRGLFQGGGGSKASPDDHAALLQILVEHGANADDSYNEMSPVLMAADDLGFGEQYE